MSGTAQLPPAPLAPQRPERLRIALGNGSLAATQHDRQLGEGRVLSLECSRTLRQALVAAGQHLEVAAARPVFEPARTLEFTGGTDKVPVQRHQQHAKLVAPPARALVAEVLQHDP